ncbi:hypothetical protein QJS66_09720 [Kocuria rhizophila]|nr:hypothetical protein QJS66_09720 [Kocuria rhizophila]
MVDHTLLKPESAASRSQKGASPREAARLGAYSMLPQRLTLPPGRGASEGVSWPPCAASPPGAHPSEVKAVEARGLRGPGGGQVDMGHQPRPRNGRCSWDGVRGVEAVRAACPRAHCPEGDSSRRWTTAGESWPRAGLRRPPRATREASTGFRPRRRRGGGRRGGGAWRGGGVAPPEAALAMIDAGATRHCRLLNSSSRRRRRGAAAARRRARAELSALLKQGGGGAATAEPRSASRGRVRHRQAARGGREVRINRRGDRASARAGLLLVDRVGSSPSWWWLRPPPRPELAADAAAVFAAG